MKLNKRHGDYKIPAVDNVLHIRKSKGYKNEQMFRKSFDRVTAKVNAYKLQYFSTRADSAVGACLMISGDGFSCHK